MSSSAAFPKSSVMFAMTLIRPLFEQYDCDVSPYSDDEIAEALLLTHPSPAAQWLSHEHVVSASAQLTPRAPSGALGFPGKSGQRVR